MNLLITGVSTYLGQAVVRHLIRKNPFKRVFGLGRRPPKVLGPVRFLPVDPRSDDLTDLLVMNDIQVVLHLAYALGTDGAKDELSVARRLMEVGALGGVERVVFASSDRVYERTEGMCAEGSPCRKAAGAPAELAGKAAVEAELAHCAKDGPTPVVIRTANIIGPSPGAPLDALLSLPFLFAGRGEDPLVQFLHIDDAARIFLAAAAQPGLTGIYNAGGAEPIHLSVAAGILQKPVWTLPRWMLGPAVDLLARTHRLPQGRPCLNALLRGVPLTSDRIQELGVSPRYSTRQTLAVWRTGHGGVRRAGQPARRAS